MMTDSNAETWCEIKQRIYRGKKKNSPKSAANRMREFRTRQKKASKIASGSINVVKNQPKSVAVRVRERRARQKALKTAAFGCSLKLDLSRENMCVANCEFLPQRNTILENNHNSESLDFIAAEDVPDLFPLCSKSNLLSDLQEQNQDYQEMNTVEKPVHTYCKLNSSKSAAKPRRSNKVRLRAVENSSIQHRDLIRRKMGVANYHSIFKPNVVDENISNTLRIFVPVDVHQADSLYNSSDSLSNSNKQVQENLNIKLEEKLGQAHEIDNATKISSQRSLKKSTQSQVLRKKRNNSKKETWCDYMKRGNGKKIKNSPKTPVIRKRNYRTRQKFLKIKNSINSVPKNPPKFVAVRAQEHRIQQKALKTAFIQHQDLIDESMRVANSESLPQPNAVVQSTNKPLRSPTTTHESDSPSLFANSNGPSDLNGQTQGNKEKNGVKKSSQAHTNKKLKKTKSSARRSLKIGAPQKVLIKKMSYKEKVKDPPKSRAVQVREYRTRHKALKTAIIQDISEICRDLNEAKSESLIRQNPIKQGQDDRRLNAVKKQARTLKRKNTLKSSAIQVQQHMDTLIAWKKSKMSTIKKRGDIWTEEVMSQALAAIMEGMSPIRASTEFNIPRRILQNLVPPRKSSKKHGCTSVLTPEQETELCYRIVRLADAGMPLTSQLLRRSVGTFCVEVNSSHRFENDIASRKWLHLFLNRHPEISERVTETANLERHAKLNRSTVGDFFYLLKKLYQDYDLMDQPERIFNIGEKICHLILPHQRQAFANENFESATVVGCGNAVGNSIPPMILLKNESFQSKHMVNLPTGTAVEVAEEDWMTGDIFSKWVLHFSKFKPRGKVLLIFDGSKSLLDVNICKAADEHDILLLCLPSNCTQELQPMDWAVFKSFESYWDEEIMKYCVRNPENPIAKFGEIFFKVWIKSMTSENIITGFKETGIFPFNFTIIPEASFVPTSFTGDSIPNIFNHDIKKEIKQERLEND